MRDLMDAMFRYFRAQLRGFQLSLELREVHAYRAQFCLARLRNLARRRCRRGYLLAVNPPRSKNCTGQQPYTDDAEIGLGHDSNRRPLVLGFCETVSRLEEYDDGTTDDRYQTISAPRPSWPELLPEQTVVAAERRCRHAASLA